MTIRVLGIFTLFLYQGIILLTPVVAIPMLLVTLIAPYSLLTGHGQESLCLIPQIVFGIGIFLKKRSWRVLLAGLGFAGMLGGYGAIVLNTDRGGEIGSGSISGAIFTACTGIPFVVVGLWTLGHALKKAPSCSCDCVSGTKCGVDNSMN